MVGTVLLDPKIFFFSTANFFQFLVIKTWILIRIGIQPKMLEPDPYQMNSDPKHWFVGEATHLLKTAVIYIQIFTKHAGVTKMTLGSLNPLTEINTNISLT
jgi:hypothetical protein